MRLNEFPINTPLTITASANGNEVSFESKIVNQDFKDKFGNNWTEIETCYKDGLPIVFENCRLSIVVTNLANHRDYKYSVPVVRLLPGKRTFLFTDEDYRPINRRECIRVPMCVQCNLQIGDNKKTIDCTVVDVSVTGIGLSFMNNCPLKENDKVSGTFFIERTQRIYRFQGHVVRIEEGKSNFRRVGIQFIKFNAEIATLLAILQREQLRKERGDGLCSLKESS